MVEDRYDPEEAEAAVARWSQVPREVALRVYTSRLVGADPSLVLHGGGNTSVKSHVTDVFGQRRPALFVKGSGWDLAHLEPAGLPAVDLPFVQRLRELDELSDDDMVNALRTHLFDASSPNPSIETLLHAFLPHRFVDHSHADAILALTNRPDGEAVARAALGDEVAVVPYVMAGFELAKVAADIHDAHPGCRALLLMNHGLFTFGDTAAESYRRHVAYVRRAEAALLDALTRQTYLPPSNVPSADEAARHAGDVLAVLRGVLAQRGGGRRKVLRWRADDELLELLADDRLGQWAASGPLTPDHVIRTKARPLLLGADPTSATLADDLHDAVEAYVHDYDAYVDAHADGSVVRLDPTPSVIWWPGVGVITAAASAKAADQAADIAEHTLRTKRRGHALGPMVGLPDAELFLMEYWELEQRKLARAEAPLARKVALVTGGAGAIGVGVARQLLALGAHVVLTDIDEARLAAADAALNHPAVATVRHDVRSSASTRAAFAEAARRFGGVDIVVANAGIAAAGSLPELTEADWGQSVAVNLDGVRHTLTEGARVLRAQGHGGDIVVISTKNVPAPGAGFGAYSATKAAAHQLARVAALELASDDVRVNLVAPDAVFAEGEVPSGLWATVGPARAHSRGLKADQLPAFYRDRNLLRAEVTGSDVGRAVAFFVTRQTPTTGAVLPVDGGLPGAFPR
jgi:rhamnose utilization protein RhaD (predicted bifunctional aldolase and dehydrogenase)/NAD(P)-dependent dehydrogenase (short-subunit alcohol dehydrogenase family)